MKLSIVTTLYKSSPYIDEFYARVSKEIVFVDDGSLYEK
jgi:glycosyltransferase involved in cell wall biosynthesis